MKYPKLKNTWSYRCKGLSVFAKVEMIRLRKVDQKGGGMNAVEVWSKFFCSAIEQNFYALQYSSCHVGGYFIYGPKISKEETVTLKSIWTKRDGVQQRQK